MLNSPAPVPAAALPEQTPEQRQIAARAAARRLALTGEQALLRMRYEEVMQWANPPWDQLSKRVNPRPEKTTAARKGEPILHIDKVGPVLMRWAVLEMGKMPTFRVDPAYVAPPHTDRDPEKEAANRKVFEIERQIAQLKSTQMENMTQEWIELNHLHRTLFWAAWGKRAFGVSILRTGWDEIEGIPTCDLLENPSQVYRGWTKRHGRRLLSWVNVAEAMSPEEANYRFGVQIPMDADGNVEWAAWTGALEIGDMDARPEQQGTVGRMVWAEEYWELVREKGQKTKAVNCFIVGGRVIQGPHTYPWQRLPFHIVENEHILTYEHGKSTAEVMIPINAAYDDMLDRQHTVIEFESGPRYKGINMAHTDDETDVPEPFKMIPLREGEDIQQLDTRVDFFPTQLHSNELKEAKYEGTGLTPIAEGMSPNAQTSGRALSAEWRAVELPLFAAIINWEPELLDIFRDWWDFGEFWSSDVKKLGAGYRRFRLKWEPVDVRDATEKTLEIVQLLQNHIIDPELAMEMKGIENPDEVMARIKTYLTDPIYNPLGFQQYLVLKQLTISVQMQELQYQQLVGQMQQQQGTTPPGEQPGQGQTPPGAQPGQQPAPGQGPVTEAQNQPGQSPQFGGVPVNTDILSRTPLQNGSGNQVTATLPGGGLPIG
jgi:hypothetical protein